jgi:hypothetical protein
MPRVVAESSSEAVFIASRLQQQEQQLAQHAKDAEHGPLLANAHHAAAAAGSDAAAAGDSSSAAGGGDNGEELQDDAEGEWSSGSGTEAEAPAGDQAAAAAASDAEGAAAAAAASKKAKFKPLQPLIVLRMTGRERNRLRVFAAPQLWQLSSFAYSAMYCSIVRSSVWYFRQVQRTGGDDVLPDAALHAVFTYLVICAGAASCSYVPAFATT